MNYRVSNRPERKFVRLRSYDYSQPGTYFITVCTVDHECLFGEINDFVMNLNQSGNTVNECWKDIPKHFKNVVLDAFVIMPNHFHGIVIISEPETGAVAGAACRAPTDAMAASGRPGSEMSPSCRTPTGVVSGPGGASSLAIVIGSFKSAVTRLINLNRGIQAVTIWQRNYYEHIIRGEQDLAQIRDYIENNPARWAEDQYYLRSAG